MKISDNGLEKIKEIANNPRWAIATELKGHKVISVQTKELYGLIQKLHFTEKRRIISEISGIFFDRDSLGKNETIEEATKEMFLTFEFIAAFNFIGIWKIDLQLEENEDSKQFIDDLRKRRREAGL